MTNKKKKIIIIGGGISGMTAGIYALENGYDVTIYEKHSIIGGQCTGWYRQGVFIDGCAHWIVGTNPTSSLYPLWKHIGAFDENSNIYDTEYFCKYDIDGTIITFYADLEKLEQELVRVAPEDKKQIRRFINGIKAYRFVSIPTKMPLDHMNIFKLCAYGLSMFPMLFHFAKYKHMSVYEYSRRFKSEILRKLFTRFMNKDYNIHSMVYIMRSLSLKDAGVVEGGSLKLAYKIKDTFVKKGGNIYTNAEVDKVLIDNDKAIGVKFKNGDVEYSDYVISSCDAYHTMYHLLDNKYEDKYFKERFSDRKTNPLSTSVLLSYKVNKILNNYPKMTNFKINPVDLGPQKIKYITIRNHSFDKTLNKDNTTITVLINTIDEVYDYLNDLDKHSYNAIKNEFGIKIKKEIINYLNLNESDISLIDVATPLTYARYTNAYRGSYMSFITTKKSKGLMRKGLVKGLSNFVMAGQWMMSPGGLPIALFTGKHAAMRIAKMDKKKFIDLDEDNLKANYAKKMV